MCGIVGCVGRNEAAPRLLEGLQRLEYRGYDSAGIATLASGTIARCRSEGKISNLAARLATIPLGGRTGIGHTRWATHGSPTETNAHPHADEHVAVVHNGIIENHRILRAELEAEGRVFHSETDTEIVLHLISRNLSFGLNPVSATQQALRRLEGAFALGIIFAGEEDLVIAARRGSPLAIGYGDGEMYLGSDALAMAHLTHRVSYLEDGDLAVLRPRGADVFDGNGRPVSRPILQSIWDKETIDKDGFDHYMEKEIYQQPAMIARSLSSMIDAQDGCVSLPSLPFDLSAIRRITIVACGSSYHAGLIARTWFEQLAGIPTDVDIASEFRYRAPILDRQGLALFISQSGETADTLAALRHCRDQGLKVVSLVNVPGSTMARESDGVIRTYAGPEIGVASTKAFTCQLAVLAAFALAVGRSVGTLTRGREREMVNHLMALPTQMDEILGQSETLHAVAADMAEARSAIFLGRGVHFPVALEGALKLKEISYIHAEGYAAGELKHGPIALIDETMPVVVCAPSDALFAKTASNVEETISRGGVVILFTDAEGRATLGDKVAATITLPTVDPFVSPILYTVPLQMLAYRVASIKGADIDQPRNLAKSVTVE